jgi:peptidoglycan/LPS O-acetylase OafA/YrhL
MAVILEKIDASINKTQAVRFYRPELDVLRFGAFLLVLIKHSFPAPDGPGLRLHLLRAVKHAGFFGVPLFFLLSAYLITELLLKEKRTTGDIRIGAFYVRRILRIWPIYLGMLLAAYIYGHIDRSAFIPKSELAAYLLLVGNWYVVLHNFMPGFALPLWSIGVEEQFYLLWPSLVRWGSEMSIIVASAAMLFVGQITLLQLSHYGATIAPTIEANSLVQFQFFALGALISVVLSGRTMRLTLLSRLSLSICGLLCYFLADFLFYAASSTFHAQTIRTVPGFALAMLGTVLIFLSALGATVPAMASSLVYLGKISYGLYIFHLVCIHFATYVARTYFHLQQSLLLVVWGMGLPLTIIVAAASYHYIETPFLRLKERFTVVRSRSI